jgi:5-methylcytosine-specific restriction endonuclease McrA
MASDFHARSVKSSGNPAAPMPAHRSWRVEKAGANLKPRDMKTAKEAISSEETKSYAQVQREVWQESQFKCSNCGSHYAFPRPPAGHVKNFCAAINLTASN